MSSWDDLGERYKVGAQGAGPTPAADRQDVWSQLQATHRMPTASITSQKPDNSADEIQRRMMVNDMPVLERSLAQLGSGFADVGLGIDQLMGKATPADVDAKRKLDAALTDGAIGGTLKFAGQTAPTLALPFGAVNKVISKVAPRLGPVVEGGVQAATASGVQPVGTGESRLFNTLSAGTIGTVLPGVAAAYRGAGGTVPPEAAALAKTAIDKYKIPLQASDLTDSKFMKSLNSLYGDLPITGGRVAARKDAKQTAFNRAVGDTFGAEGDRLTSDVVKNAHEKITGNFDAIYSRNPADAFKLNSELQGVLQRAAKEGTADQQRVIRNRVDELFSRIDENSGTIDGNFFNRWQSDLRKKAGNDDLLNELRASALKAYNAGISGDDAKLLGLTRTQYKNFKTIEPLLDKSATGDISPGLVQSRVANQTSDFSRGGGGDLGELGRIGSRFMVDRTPQTGGSMRGLLQNSLIAGVGVAPFAAPLQWATNNNLVRNAIVQRSLAAPTVSRGLLSAPAPEMLPEIVKRATVQSSPALLGGLLSF